MIKQLLALISLISIFRSLDIQILYIDKSLKKANRIKTNITDLTNDCHYYSYMKTLFQYFEKFRCHIFITLFFLDHLLR